MTDVAISSYPNTSQDPPISFENFFECEASQAHYGFKSWDGFFIEIFREGIRPVDAPNDASVITTACELGTLAIACKVKERDTF